MAFFTYKAADGAGKIVKAVIEAESEAGAAGRIQELGLIPIRITPADKQGRLLALGAADPIKMLFDRVSGKDILLFTKDLATLLDAGLPVDRALGILASIAEKGRLKNVVAEILKTVQGGAYLSDALAKYPRVFSDFYVNMVRAGEAGGVLETVLTKLGEFLESSQELKDYMKTALIYPVFLLLVGGISIIILLMFVIPKFSMIFADMGQGIPASTKLLLNFSSFLRDNWWWLGAGILLLGLTARQYWKTPAGRLAIDRLKMRLPVSAALVQKIEVARFARTLGTLVRSGVPILQALTLVKGIIGNRVIAGAMDRINERVKGGDRLSQPLKDSGHFPILAVQMITVGEETGRLDEMLLKVAENYEKIVRNLIKRLVSILEPAMILFMGLVVGFVVISMLMAIFSLNDMPI